MFYEESTVKNLFKCNKCNEHFNLKHQPKILECGTTICSSCEANLNNKFKCNMCLKEHQIEANGLVFNEILWTIMQEKPEKVQTDEINNRLFYKESIVINFLKCKQCYQFYDIYEPHLVLKCGKSICSKCYTKIKPINNTIKCLACQEEHKISNTLIKNEFILELYSLKPIELKRTKSCEELKTNLKKLKSILSDLELIGQNGDFKIKDHCDEQRRLIQLNKEIKILELNDEPLEDEELYETLQVIVDDYEKDCIKSLSNKKEFKKLITDIVQETNGFMFSTQANLEEYAVNETQIEITNELCQSIILQLNQEVEHLNGELFNNEIIKYDSNTNNIEFEPISFKLASGSSDRSIKIWCSKSEKCLRTIKAHIGSIVGLIKFDDKLVSASSDKTIKIWNLDTGHCIRTIEAHSEPIKYIQLVANNQLISCSNDKAILLWDLTDGNCLQTFLGHYDYINCVDKISNNKIVSCSSDCTIKIWDLKTGNCLKTLLGHTRWVWSLKVISCERIISGSYDKTIKLWDLNSGDCLSTFEGHSGPVTSVVKLSDSKIASCSFDKTIKVWNLVNGKCLKTIQAHSSFIRTIVNLTSNIIISCSDDKTIKIWNLNNGNCLKTFHGHSSYVNSIYIIR